MVKALKRKKKSGLVDRIVSEAKKQPAKSKGSSVETFIRLYYKDVPPQDIQAEKPATLWGAAKAHLEFSATRSRAKALVRAYNPTLKADGWKSAHSVVEIVADNMPFLVDSITALLNSRNLTVHLVVHPVLKIKRDKAGKLVRVLSPNEPDTGATSETMLRFEVSQQPLEQLENITKEITKTIKAVRASVEDWRPMRESMMAMIDELTEKFKGIPSEVVDESRDFLRWAYDNNFTFLGFREYNFEGSGKKVKASVEGNTGLGLLRSARTAEYASLSDLACLPPARSVSKTDPSYLLIIKTEILSPVHRPVYLDAIAVKKMDSRGKVIGQRLFLGLFTSSAYSSSPREIPLLRRKLQNVVSRAQYGSSSHSGKALANVLETYPRDELFQISEDDLYNTGLGILHLQERQRVALFTRRDNFDRYISCLIFVPRDIYSMSLRERLQKTLEKTFKGKVAAHHIEFGDSALARLHISIKTTPGKIPNYNVTNLEAELVNQARTWTGGLTDALTRAHGEARALEITERYGKAFPRGYQDTFSAEDAVGDIVKIDEAIDNDRLCMALYRQKGAKKHSLNFKVYNPDRAVPLSDVLPMLEHMGLRVVDEHPFRIRPLNDGDRTVMIQDFGVETRSGASVKLEDVNQNFQDTFIRTWTGQMESDGFNALVLQAGLAWRDVVVLRAYSKYLRQAGIGFSQAYMEQTLANNPKLTRLIVNLFSTLFDPTLAKTSEKRAKDLRRKIRDGLNQVTSADEDRIISRFINAVDSTLRTNFYQRRSSHGEPKAYASFKLDSGNIDELPLPRPFREIFVYSPKIEGVHLRFGMVARGGLRWSDRREDFRTEILGLVKAQQVKNAVIVPVGSKGGFVVKKPPTSGGREAFINEGIACYKTFISGLLDITDNLVGSRLIPPANTIRRDGDDPYLVVAADKGTATFSDIANGVSDDYGFWLGDAFASGGSIGYDHKKMGITAKGAWESVKRHFREMGVNTQKEEFTVVGVGDMSGDVFGNGMMLSPHIKLLGAFNHLHIFVDPDPDPAKSLAERKRLFKLPRSSWGDYDAKLLSKGGAIFDRSAKSLTLTPEIKACFGITQSALSPNELLGHMLRAEVGLLWFGGIGTYIKASDETDADAGDRANDPIRINGKEVRAKVIGEGANLGVTQRGRIEYGLNGGRLNSDSIDNSAGVDCSDHEVNIKILVNSAIAGGGMDQKQRTSFLASMTKEVGELCLVDNYEQTQTISMSQFQGTAVLDNQVRLMRMLERLDILNRSVEYLPDDETIAERAQAEQALTRPEIGVLLSYSKNWLYGDLLQTPFPDDPFLVKDLVQYFPTPMREKFKEYIGQHRLRREIIATVSTNEMINRVGETFVTEFMEKTGMPAADIVRAFTIVRNVFDLDELWDEIESLDNKVPANVQTVMHLTINALIDWGVLWFLRHGKRPLDIGSEVAEYQAGVHVLTHNTEAALPRHYINDIGLRAKPSVAKGVPEKLANRIAALVNLYTACDIVRLATSRKISVAHVSNLYYFVSSQFRLGRLRAAAEGLDSSTHWQKLAIDALVEEIYGHQLRMTTQILDFAGPKMAPEKALAQWTEHNQDVVDQANHLLTELWTTGMSDVSMVAVASRQLRALADTADTK
ncbi:MAG: NAD-glutamate dehydrogenase [Rhodospirillales bacterium]|nr:NAD-glutamate dehydrogenase [Rhodospirillales bacterium]